MSKKLIVGLIIILVVVFMIADFRFNGVSIFENFSRQMETESIRELRYGNDFSNYQGESAETDFNNQIVDLNNQVDTLYMNNSMGTISISGQDREDIGLSYKIIVYARTKELAESTLNKLELKTDIRGSRLEIGIKDIESIDGVYGIRKVYTLTVPRELLLDITNKYGRLYVSDIEGDVVLSNTYSGIDKGTVVRNISGNAEVYARYVDANISDIGSLKLDSAYNAIDVRNIAGDSKIELDYGAGEVDNINGSLELRCSYGDFDFNNIKGDLDMYARYTDVKGTDVSGELIGEISYGHLSLSNIVNDLKVKGRYTGMDFDMNSDLTDYTIYSEVDYGNINTNLPFEITKDDYNTRIMEGKAGSSEKNIDIRSDHGDVSIYN